MASNRKLSTYLLIGGTIYEPGTPESKIKGKVTAEGVWDGDAGSSSSDGGDPPAGYDDLKVEDLQAEADKRGLTVEGSGANGNVVKPDLVAALKADDEANGES